MAPTRLALLRGINVGGKNTLPMADLRDLAVGLGWSEVATYIASGNLVFSADGTEGELTRALAGAVEARVGKPVRVIVLPAASWCTAVRACPYAPTDARHVHVQVHASSLPPAVRTTVERLVADADDGTEVAVDGRWVYLHTPQGLSRSVAFTELPRVLPKTDPGTARNLRTATAIAGLLEAR